MLVCLSVSALGVHNCTEYLSVFPMQGDQPIFEPMSNSSCIWRKSKPNRWIAIEENNFTWQTAFEPQPVVLSRISRSVGQSGSGLPGQCFRFFTSIIRSIVQGFLKISANFPEHGLHKRYGGNISRAARRFSTSITDTRSPNTGTLFQNFVRPTPYFAIDFMGTDPPPLSQPVCQLLLYISLSFFSLLTGQVCLCNLTVEREGLQEPVSTEGIWALSMSMVSFTVFLSHKRMNVSL